MTSAPLSFTVKERISKPLAEVYKAVADPAISCRYFMVASTGPIERGATLTWTWPISAQSRVTIEEAVPNELIRLHWKVSRGDGESVETLKFTAVDATSTLVEATETGWPDDENGRYSAFDNCAGWQHMLLSLKVFLLYGIELRK